MTDWREVESRVFTTTGRRMPVVVVRGEGTRVWDDAGKTYLDFVDRTLLQFDAQAPVGGVAGADGNGLARWRELVGVAQQVPEDLLQPRRIAFYVTARRIQFQAQRLLFQMRIGKRHLDNLLDQHVHVDNFDVK